MIISKAIRYLAERLGIKTTGTGISDAIMDLAAGFPFGEETKVVNTVVYEDEFYIGGSGNTGIGSSSDFSWLTEGTVCKVTINDEVYENVIASAPDRYGHCHLTFGNYNTFYLIDDDQYWINGVPETTNTLKIEKAEVQTVVTQLPAKFVPAGTGDKTIVFTTITNGNQHSCNMSYDDVVKNLARPIIYHIDQAGVFNYYLYPTMTQFSSNNASDDKDIVVIGFNLMGSEITVKYHPDGTIEGATFD